MLIAIIIYDGSDSGLHYKTIMIYDLNLALARNVNYEHKSWLTIVIHGYKTFIAQATVHIKLFLLSLLTNTCNIHDIKTSFID